MENTIKILVTTDNHVGYMENDPVVGDDSWKTFHEILSIAKANDVDMILQSGDLFHLNKPSKKSMYQVMKSLRSTLMGDKPCELELLSDPSQVFQYNEFTNVNYEDPNLNVSIPMFAISGNHDDSSGDQLLTPMDLLHVSGLVNHFGKTLVTDHIQLTPLLFQKGTTKLALYGLQSIREERLFRTFKEGGVEFNIPTVRDGEWFNLMCLHQNHTGHTNTAFLPEQFLPDFMDLIIWGHEHECIPNFTFNPIQKFNVLQPGSSIATSLCDAEAREKNVFILEINEAWRHENDILQPKLTPIPLNSVRTFKLQNLTLSDYQDKFKPHEKEKINKFLTEIVEQMIKDANNETKKKLNTEHLDDEENPNENDNTEDELITLPMPLIRLKVDYTGPQGSNIDYQVENPRRFSNKFVGHVANVNNVIQFYKKSKTNKQNKKLKNDALLQNGLLSKNDDNTDNNIDIDKLISDMLNKMQLSLLPELGFNEAVKTFVDKDEKNALKKFIDEELINEVEILMTNRELIENENPDDIKLLMKEVKRSNTVNVKDKKLDRSSKEPDQPVDVSGPSTKKISSRTRKSDNKNNSSIVISSDEDDEEPNAYNDDESEKEEEANMEDLITVSDDELDSQFGTYNTSKKASVVKSSPSKKRTRGGKPVTTRKSTRPKATATKNAKTPKTNLLRDFLAQKRK